jgi:hypothetical protein
VCFSLACFAHQRQCGHLITVFSTSPYSTDPRLQHPDKLRDVTRQRCAEDSLFAKECGLSLEFLEFQDAMARKESLFDAKRSEAISKQIEKKLMAALVGPLLGRASNNKPWLFVPIGIGGHVDHLAVLKVVLRYLNVLDKGYRIAFYEDLFYASQALSRQLAIAALHSALEHKKLLRLRLSLDQKLQHRKLRLVELYASQLKEELKSIKAFTPADKPNAVPHEALWVFQEL